jgi:hypothetical protein
MLGLVFRIPTLLVALLPDQPGKLFLVFRSNRRSDDLLFVGDREGRERLVSFRVPRYTQLSYEKFLGWVGLLHDDVGIDGGESEYGLRPMKEDRVNVVSESKRLVFTLKKLVTKPKMKKRRR